MGKLICIEGVDASGKGTQCNLIKQYFKDNNISFEYFHFPMYGHNQFSDIISRFLRGEFGDIDDVDPTFIATMYAMDRYKFSPNLKKYLEENDVVLLDRYVYSNIAFQCAKVKGKIGANLLQKWIKDFEFGFLNLPKPDLNIFLDVPIEITKKRLENREGSDREYLEGKKDIHESDLEFQEKVREYYLSSMKDEENCQIISCTNQPQEIFEMYKKYIELVLIKDYCEK